MRDGRVWCRGRIVGRSHGCPTHYVIEHCAWDASKPKRTAHTIARWSDLRADDW